MAKRNKVRSRKNIYFSKQKSSSCLSFPREEILWVYNNKEIKELRDKMIKEQDGIDPITKEILTSPCLDHDHFEGRCRGVLNMNTNTFEGQVLRAWMRYVSEYTTTSLSEALFNLAIYLEKDYSINPLHGQHIRDMYKALRRMNKATIIARAKSDFNVEINDSLSKDDMIILYMTTFIKREEERIL